MDDDRQTRVPDPREALLDEEEPEEPEEMDQGGEGLPGAGPGLSAGIAALTAAAAAATPPARSATTQELLNARKDQSCPVPVTLGVITVTFSPVPAGTATISLMKTFWAHLAALPVDLAPVSLNPDPRGVILARNFRRHTTLLGLEKQRLLRLAGWARWAGWAGVW